MKHPDQMNRECETVVIVAEISGSGSGKREKNKLTAK